MFGFENDFIFIKVESKTPQVSCWSSELLQALQEAQEVKEGKYYRQKA
jgi:hypothetical protein